MRFNGLAVLGWVASLLLGVALGGAVAHAQTNLPPVRGEVESIGIGNTFRPDCWTGMLVRLRIDGGKSGKYFVQVRQRDLDGDQVRFTREVTLTAGGDATTQRFWVYFKPEVVEQGLPDQADAGSLPELQKRLRVFLLDADGRELTALPVTSTIQNLDYAGQNVRGRRLVVFVGSRNPQFRELEGPETLGLAEESLSVKVAAADLPDSVLGYDAVDAVVWTDANPSDLTDESKRALEQYIRRGGRLIVCAGDYFAKLAPFADWLPVVMERTERSPGSGPLTEILLGPDGQGNNSLVMVSNLAGEADWKQPWTRLGSYQAVRAKPKANALVEHWIVWDRAKADFTPWLARGLLGAGSVTFVAQDLTDPTINRGGFRGWGGIWATVLGWPDRVVQASQQDVITGNGNGKAAQRFVRGQARDLGFTTVQGLDISEQSTALVLLSVGFFIVYWLVAGPGTFAWLTTRKKRHWSWPAFATAAVLATFATTGVVWLVLGGKPDLRHVSVVRLLNDGTGVVESRFGLYIPRDGDQTIALAAPAPAANGDTPAPPAGIAEAAGGTVSAANPHPAHIRNDELVLAPQQYEVEPASNRQGWITVPFRSTLKKMEASWTGALPARVSGTAALADYNSGLVKGKLVNDTGADLENVYLCIRHPALATQGQFLDWIFFVPNWKADETLDLAAVGGARVMSPDGASGVRARLGFAGPVKDTKIRFDANRVVYGTMNDWLAEAWYDRYLRPDMLGDVNFTDFDQRAPKVIPMLSLFGRLPAMEPDPLNPARADLLRRAGRSWDASAAVSAGGMVIVATAKDRPIPLPLEVGGSASTGQGGSRVPGRGTVIYQFVVPVNRAGLDPKPSTQPAGPEGSGQ